MPEQCSNQAGGRQLKSATKQNNRNNNGRDNHNHHHFLHADKQCRGHNCLLFYLVDRGFIFNRCMCNSLLQLFPLKSKGILAMLNLFVARPSWPWSHGLPARVPPANCQTHTGRSRRRACGGALGMPRNHMPSFCRTPVLGLLQE